MLNRKVPTMTNFRNYNFPCISVKMTFKNDIIALIEYAMSIKPKAHNFEIQKDNFEGYVLP